MSAGGLLLYDAKIISTRARADWLSREMLNVHFVRWKSVFYKRAVVATAAAAATSACRSNQELTIASEAGQYILFEIYGDAFFILGAYALRIYSSNQTHKLNCVCIEMRCEMCAQACIYLIIIICRIIAPPRRPPVSPQQTIILSGAQLQNRYIRIRDEYIVQAFFRRKISKYKKKE